MNITSLQPTDADPPARHISKKVTAAEVLSPSCRMDTLWLVSALRAGLSATPGLKGSTFHIHSNCHQTFM